jgi:hypothetical protein
MRDKLPPETCYPDSGPEPEPENHRPAYGDVLDGYGDSLLQFVLAVKDGRLALKETKRGHDLYLYGNPDDVKFHVNFQTVMQTLRAFRVIQRNHTMPNDGFDLLESDGRNKWFVASLAPGTYEVTHHDDGWDVLVWDDTIGTTIEPDDTPRHEPETAPFAAVKLLATPTIPQSIPRRPLPPETPPAPKGIARRQLPPS